MAESGRLLSTIVENLGARILPIVRWQARGKHRLLSAVSVVALGIVVRALSWWWVARRWWLRHKFLHLSSPLEGTAVRLAVPSYQRRRCWFWVERPTSWTGFCPSCKRPFDARLSLPWNPPPPKPDARGRYAYLICLWGSSAEYVLGALVLGQSIKNTGSKHARVCMHTADVPQAFIELLSAVWECRLIEHVNEVEGLSFDTPGTKHRFRYVFTKLRGMQQTDFAKVLMMDIDLLVRGNIDHLFEMHPPVALRRGMNDSKWPNKHGDKLDGKRFFLGREKSQWSWGQGTGINAGVMLWQPSQEVFNEMMLEITEPNHPEHVRGNGPEQDYLSRFWAGTWTNLGVQYNYQLHQMFFALHPFRNRRIDRLKLLSQPDEIKVLHFSGESIAKPWHRVLDSQLKDYWPDRSFDDAYASLFAETFQGYQLWIQRNREAFAETTTNPYTWDMEGLYMDKDNHIWMKGWNGQPDTFMDLPPFLSKGAMNLLRGVLREWFDTLQQLEKELGLDLQAALLGPPTEQATCTPDTKNVTDKSGTDRTAGVKRSEQSKFASWQLQRTWWTESWDNHNGFARASVVCCGAGSNRFVMFKENGIDVFEKFGPVVSGVFANVVGQNSPRHFSVPCATMDSNAGLDDVDETLVSLRLWVECVPPDAVVMLAALSVPPQILKTMLEILQPMGLPPTPPAPKYVALAAVIHIGPMRACETAQNFSDTDTTLYAKGLCSNHASEDIAYAATWIPPCDSTD